jgi:acetyl-CoA C-acetyltransferase
MVGGGYPCDMAEAFIVDAIRTPIGRRNGGLSTVHPADLGAHTIKALIERTDIDPGDVDDVVFGNVESVGPQSMCIARTCWLAAGLPEHVPGVTIDRQCGSSQQAVQFAAQAVMSGTMDLVVAGGVENMSMVPITSAINAGQALGFDDPFSGSSGWTRRYGSGEVSQFRGAEMIAKQYDVSRDDMEQFAVESHVRALLAQAECRFEREIVPINGVENDEGPREPNWDKIRSLPVLLEGGHLTAACASQISDGSAALLIAGEAAVNRYGLRPRARIHHISVLGADPIVMLSAPIAATQRALEKADMKVDDIHVAEANEAFAPVVVAWLRATGFDHSNVNVNGGAIALGHPLGASGARLMTTLLHELERTGGRFGLQTMCEGGGQANVTIIERL